ncbi:flagellin [bacterium]|nr:flagellin [bacterium]
MGLRIRTNVQSLTAQRNLSGTNKAAGESMNKLSSGYRINKSADDAAGLAISEKMKAGIVSEKQAKRNANDGVSMLQVAEGAMNEVSNILVRMRELTVQSASDTVSNVEREFTNREYTQLTEEIDRISNVTDFSGVNLLKGQDGNEGIDSENLTIHVGKGANVGPEANADTIDINIDAMKMDSETLGLSGSAIGPEEPGGSYSRENSAEQLVKLDDALNNVASQRATIGAKQNRLQSTMRNLDVSIENQSAAKSRIKDVDYASESATYAQQNILKQGGASILAQSNSLPELALGLLR